MPKVSIVVPAYTEAENIPVLYERLCQVMKEKQLEWELIVVDDHSSDETFAKVSALAKQDGRVRGIRFARNYGSYTAIMCGLQYAGGDCAVFMAADLQDPPEVIPELLSKWREGYHVVWATRVRREGESFSTLFFARVYYWVVRHIIGIKEMPASGTDFALMDRRVIDSLGQFDERNISLMVLIIWMGFRQTHIEYTKKARLHGTSGWSLGKKFKLVVDSVISFSFLPIRMMSYLGVLIASAGLVYAVTIIVNAFVGNPAQGWTSIIVVLLILGGMQITMLGILGEYLWRTLDESHRRPRYLIEATTDRENK